MMLAPLTPELRKVVVDTLAIDYDTLKVKSEHILEWWKSQPHLPHLPGLKIINRGLYLFIICMYYIKMDSGI